jgi:hypothetical protein
MGSILIKVPKVAQPSSEWGLGLFCCYGFLNYKQLDGDINTQKLCYSFAFYIFIFVKVNSGNLIYHYYQDGNLIVSSRTLLLNEFPLFHRLVIS